MGRCSSTESNCRLENGQSTKVRQGEGDRQTNPDRSPAGEPDHIVSPYFTVAVFKPLKTTNSWITRAQIISFVTVIPSPLLPALLHESQFHLRYSTCLDSLQAELFDSQPTGRLLANCQLTLNMKHRRPHGRLKQPRIEARPGVARACCSQRVSEALEHPRYVRETGREEAGS